MSIRTNLRDALRAEPKLDERFLIPDQPLIPSNTAAAVKWILSVEQASVKPGPTMRTYEHELHVILAVPTVGVADIETQLEDGLEIVLEVLAESGNDYGFVSADRDVLGNLNDYDLTFTIASTYTEE